MLPDDLNKYSTVLELPVVGYVYVVYTLDINYRLTMIRGYPTKDKAMKYCQKMNDDTAEDVFYNFVKLPMEYQR